MDGDEPVFLLTRDERIAALRELQERKERKDPVATMILDEIDRLLGDLLEDG